MGAAAHPSSAPLLRYRGRDVGDADLEFVRGVINLNLPTRRAICTAICQRWLWHQASGGPALQACLDLLLRLEEWGHICLPPSRGRSRRRAGEPRAPTTRFPVLPVDLIALTGLEVRDPGVDLRGLIVRPIVPEERQGWRLYMARYHDLGDRTVVGEHILYAAFLDGELVALLGWASAAFRAPLREAYIGWGDDVRPRRLHLIANNTRFLVPPWVQVKNLASKVLAANLRRLSSDWEAVWNHPVLLAETFVDTARFRGTCYRAANWIYLGQTAGRTKRGNEYLFGGSPKSLYVYPLHRRALARLRGEGGPP